MSNYDYARSSPQPAASSDDYGHLYSIPLDNGADDAVYYASVASVAAASMAGAGRQASQASMFSDSALGTKHSASNLDSPSRTPPSQGKQASRIPMHSHHDGTAETSLEDGITTYWTNYGDSRLMQFLSAGKAHRIVCSRCQQSSSYSLSPSQTIDFSAPETVLDMEDAASLPSHVLDTPQKWAKAVSLALGSSAPLATQLLCNYLQHAVSATGSFIQVSMHNQAWNENTYHVGQAEEGEFAVPVSLQDQASEESSTDMCWIIFPCGHIYDQTCVDSTQPCCKLEQHCKRTAAQFSNLALKLVVHSSVENDANSAAPGQSADLLYEVPTPHKPTGMFGRFMGSVRHGLQRVGHAIWGEKSVLKGADWATYKGRRVLTLTAAAAAAATPLIIKLLKSSSDPQACEYDDDVVNDYHNLTMLLNTLSYVNQTARSALPDLDAQHCDSMTDVAVRVVSNLGGSVAVTCKDVIFPIINGLAPLGVALQAWRLQQMNQGLAQAQDNPACPDVNASEHHDDVSTTDTTQEPSRAEPSSSSGVPTQVNANSTATPSTIPPSNDPTQASSVATSTQGLPASQASSSSSSVVPTQVTATSTAVPASSSFQASPFSSTAVPTQVTANSTATPTVFSSTTTASQAPIIEPIAFRPAANYTTSRRPQPVVTGDFNGDGHLDIAAANNLDSTLSVYLGNGDGTFQNAQIFATQSYPWGMVVGDINHDGYLDLIVTNEGTDTYTLFTGRSNGIFNAPIHRSCADSLPTGVVLGHFDGDPHLDMAIGFVGSGNVKSYKGNGDGTFQNPINYAAVSQPQNMASADLDGNGIDDIVVTSANSNSIGFLYGNLNGQFNRPIKLYDIGSLSGGVAIGRYNQDTPPDIVVSRPTFNDLAVILNHNYTSFDAPVLYPVGRSPFTIVTGNFSATQSSGIAVANINSGSVSVLAANASGVFGPAHNLTAGAQPWGLASGDFDGDGFSDLVATNSGSDSLSVFLSRS
ncbi:MAG: VCBS repeat-containing protein [Verrucomicrobia bacterium]|nr:VCBS repeat-containing protein [Verrucomicrobiota bacterium]MBS0645237.1 VCBS repeat-containing protein [Verrucomicrobiota bacterium]